MQALPHLSDVQMKHWMFLSSSVARLLLAGFLGGSIGVERTIHHKSAGIRTNMFICIGAAMFTILSDVIPDPSLADRTRIASNVVQGVGFLGAGAIIHGKGGVAGLTTAATIWVVASIGIAAGAGHYLLATFATGVILLALFLLGSIETKLGLKRIAMSYEIKGESAPKICRGSCLASCARCRSTKSSRRISKWLQTSRASPASTWFLKNEFTPHP